MKCELFQGILSFGLILKHRVCNRDEKKSADNTSSPISSPLDAAALRRETNSERTAVALASTALQKQVRSSSESDDVPVHCLGLLQHYQRPCDRIGDL